MIFKFFIFMVFIAELIIMLACLSNLINLDNKINAFNKIICKNQSKIKEIMVLIKGISEQILELSPIWVEKIKTIRNSIFEKQVNSIISNILFWYINIKMAKFLKKSKTLRTIMKGLTLVQNMI